MCNSPVTLGGGIAMQYGGLSGLISALKRPFSSQKSYHFFSIAPGSYVLASSSVMPRPLFYFFV